MAVLGRALDDSFAPELRDHITEVTVSRMIGSACYRFTAPFLATIARGLHVSLQEIGVAVAIAELCGLLGPVVGHVVDRMSRRGAMTLGLAGVLAGAVLAASSTGAVMFAVALVVISQSKSLFDLANGAWIIDHTAYDVRSRVIGVNETSWAAALLVGVSLMGLATAAAGWRAGFATGAIAAAVAATTVWLRVPDRTVAERHHEATPQAHGRINVTGWFVIATTLAMTAASHCIVITFGGWLEDGFGFTPAGITAVVFCLGVVELLASVTSARRTDTWGKARSTAYGVGLMVPGALALALWHGHLLPGLLGFAVMVLGFEFAIVSVLGLGERVVPGAPGRGLGLLFAAGTFGRALVTIPATTLYQHGGIGHTALLSAALAGIALAATWRLDRATRT